MKTIDNATLDIISKIIVENISTSSIYCFGEKKTIQAVHNPFQEDFSTHKEHTHYYLMALTDEYIINAVNDISDIIKNKTDGKYLVTLLLFNVKNGHYFSINQRYLYHQILSKGYKIYERENRALNISFDKIPERRIKYIRSYWENRSKIAKAFLSAQNQIDHTENGFVQDSMMHLAVEQLCLGLISVFLGYHPNHFSLTYLFDLCEIFTPLTSDIFPRTTSEDKRLFELLKTNPSSLRWMNIETSSLLDTDQLKRRCSLFYERACSIADAELEFIEKSNASA